MQTNVAQKPRRMFLKNADESPFKAQPQKISKKKTEKTRKKKGEAAEIVADIKSQLNDLAKVCVCVQEASFANAIGLFD